MDMPVISFSKFHLDNGLTVIVHEDHKAPVVAVSIWYHVGSAYEPSGKTGFAHLFEHLMFSGSEHHKDVFFKPFELAGATDQNGTTWFDRTNYFQTVPTTALDMALWMESDRMGHLLGAIGQAELDTQRGVVQNEKRQNENQPYGRVWERIQLDAFPANHPYQHTTIGSMNDLDAASLDDVHQWFRTYYGAANTTLVLAGDITPEIAREKAQAYFGDIPSGPPIVRPAPWPAARTQSTRGEIYDHVAQIRLMREWNAPGVANEDVPLLELAATVLGGGATSRLVQRLVYRDRLADTVSAGLLALELASMFVLSADIRSGADPTAVERAVAEEWESFLITGPTEDEVLRAKTSLQATFVRGLEKVGGLGGKAAVLAEGQVYRDDPAAYRTDLERLQAATPASVRAAARRWLAHGDHTLLVRPLEPGVDAAIANRAAPGLPAAADKPVPSPSAAQKKYTVTDSTIDRLRGVPSVDQFPRLSFPCVQRARLKNGIEVVIAERHAIPATQVLVQFDTTVFAGRGRRSGLTALAMSMLEEGTQDCDSVEIAKRLQRLGASLSVSSGLDIGTVGINALNSGLAGALQLLADVVRNPAFRADDLERLRAQKLAAIRQERSSPAAMVNRVLPQLLYGEEHPYGAPFSGIGTEQSIGSLTSADLFYFHREVVRPDNATIFVVGATAPETIVTLLDNTFGDWMATSAVAHPDVFAAVAPPSRPRVFLIHRADAIQSQIAVGALATPTSSPDCLATQIAHGVFAGTFTSRLNMNLREDKRWTYGVRGMLADALGQRPLVISAPVQTDRTAEAIREISNELHAVSSHRPPTQEEIDKLRLQQIRTLPGSYETSGAVLSTLSSNHLYGRTDDHAVHLKDRLDALTDAEVTAAAKALLEPETCTWVVVGDLSKIEQPLRALGIGEVIVLGEEELAGI
ncbi:MULTISPECIES: pitrilysin family protein [unclassified Rudaea]|uniref:M16 family metallopeptidase n=1 Tax=unclassified Rudaea TaxID=2627037 RepID=UPI0020165463|nr:MULTISPECIES: pitrilysin family protein [unclassified Rudaea]